LIPMRYLFAALLALTGWGPLLGEDVSIEGEGAGYANRTIQVSVAYNPFVNVPVYRESLQCDESGHFSHSFPLEAGRVVQFETGAYQAYLYMEPGYHYQVVLPPFREKRYDELISPYAQPISIPLEVISRTDLRTGDSIPGRRDVNFQIARFDSAFYRANESVILQRRLGQDSDLDSIETSLETAFSVVGDPFFREYRKYRYGVLRLNEGKTGLEEISRHYLGPVIRVSHPGFVELFRAMFKDFIYYYSNTMDGKSLRGQINRTHDLDSVRMIIQTHPAIWCDTVADMVLLQELSTLFYRGDYHQEAILMLLDSMNRHPVSAEMAHYSLQVKEKLTSLMTGYSPPEFHLTDLHGHMKSPEDYAGKYTYLLFCTPDHYGCMMEYPYLQSYQEKHADYLNVVSIMVADGMEKLAEFVERNGYSWEFLYYGEEREVLNAYQIRAFPTAFLVGPDGKLLLSPSPLPSDGFEQQLFRIMRSRGEI
jgi:thiol-disulfide isomerase/thioredoxin